VLYERIWKTEVFDELFPFLGISTANTFSLLETAHARQINRLSTFQGNSRFRKVSEDIVIFVEPSLHWNLLPFMNCNQYNQR
jgi:hypothetical protein